MKKIILLLLSMNICTICNAQLTVKSLLTENLINPISIDATNPALSWQISAPARDIMQTAYQIRVSADINDLVKGKHLTWDPGKISSDQSQYIIYQGDHLLSGKKYFWQVKVWGKSGKNTGWSEPASLQMGLLSPSDWQAKWITPGYKEDAEQPSPMFRKEFTSAKKLNMR